MTINWLWTCNILLAGDWLGFKYQYILPTRDISSTVIFKDDRAVGCSGKMEERATSLKKMNLKEMNLKMERTSNRCK